MYFLIRTMKKKIGHSSRAEPGLRGRVSEREATITTPPRAPFDEYCSRLFASAEGVPDDESAGRGEARYRLCCQDSGAMALSAVALGHRCVFAGEARQVWRGDGQREDVYEPLLRNCSGAGGVPDAGLPRPAIILLGCLLAT